MNKRLAWVRGQSRPAVVYVTRWTAGGLFYSVSEDRAAGCWRAWQGIGMAATGEGEGIPRAFATMEAAMLWCERRANGLDEEGE